MSSSASVADDEAPQASSLPLASSVDCPSSPTKIAGVSQVGEKNAGASPVASDKQVPTSISSISKPSIEICVNGGQQGADSSDNKGETISDYSVSWPTALQSPLISSFSPAHEVGKTSSLHGLGLQATTDRARQISRSGKKAAGLLVEVSTIYDQFTQALIKASQALNPIASQANAISIQESLVSWTSETSKMSSTLRASIAQPLDNFLTTFTEMVIGVNDRYVQCRKFCSIIRQRALRYQTKYVMATREAEQAIAEWKEKENDSKDDNENLPGRITSKVQKAQRLKSQYKAAVERENAYVALTQRLEFMALDTMQLIEEDRLTLFIMSLTNLLVAETQALSDTELRYVPNTTVPESSLPEKKAKKPFAGLLKPFVSGIVSFEEGSGIVDADTLGLPEAIGKLREDVRAMLVSKSNKIVCFRVLSTFLDDVTVALDKLGSSLKQLVGREDSKNKGLEGILDEMKSNESSRVCAFWDAALHTLNLEALGALAMASKIRHIRSEQLDSLIMYGEKSIKAASETEETMWRQLCESARGQMKAAERYKQSTVQASKARDRASSAEDEDVGGMIRINKHVSKSLVNMFSILPDGGENAIKMLGPGARATLAQRTLEEAGQKENQDRQALDSAVDTTVRLLDLYKVNAETWVLQYTEEMNNGWADPKPIFEAFLSIVRLTRGGILTAVQELQKALEMCVERDVPLAMNEWQLKAQLLVKGQHSLAARNSESDTTGISADNGFKLTFLRESTSLISAPSSSPDSDQTRANSESNSDDLADSDEMDAEDEENDVNIQGSGARTPVEASQTEAPESSLASNWLAPESSLAANWLQRTLTAESLRGKLSIRPKMPGRYKKYENLGEETEIFATFFSPESADPQAVPRVVESFCCSYRPDSKPLPSQYGFIFLSEFRLIFVSWTGKTKSLRLADEILSQELAINFAGLKSNAIRVSFRSGAKNISTMFIGGFYHVEKALQTIEQFHTSAQKSAAEEKEKMVLNVPDTQESFIPPDATMQKMDIIVNKQLHNISVRRFYDTVWSDQERPFYRRWVERACFDVEIGEWEHSNVQGPWDKEIYPQKRIIKFKIQRKTHLYIGPPIANVRQTMFCRVEGDNKCVMALRTEFDGIPYSDCFAVEVRWVAQREGKNSLAIQVGVVVDFVKYTIISRQIKAGTLEETTPVHKNLFEEVKRACKEAAGINVVEAEPEEIDEGTIREQKAPATVATKNVLFGLDPRTLLLYGMPVLLFFAYRALGSRRFSVGAASQTSMVRDIASLEARIDRLEMDLKVVKGTLDEILVLLKTERK